MNDVPAGSFCSDLPIPGYDLFLQGFYECLWVIFDYAADDFIFDSLGNYLLDGYVLEGESESAGKLVEFVELFREVDIGLALIVEFHESSSTEIYIFYRLQKYFRK